MEEKRRIPIAAATKTSFNTKVCTERKISSLNLIQKKKTCSEALMSLYSHPAA